MNRVLVNIAGGDNYKDSEAGVVAILISYGPPSGIALAGTC